MKESSQLARFSEDMKATESVSVPSLHVITAKVNILQRVFKLFFLKCTELKWRVQWLPTAALMCSVFRSTGAEFHD